MKTNRLISLIAILGLLLGSGAPAALADSSAPNTASLPHGLTLVEKPGPVDTAPDSDGPSSGQSRLTPPVPRGPLAAATVSLIVYLDKPALAQVGKGMSPDSRVQYAAEVAAVEKEAADQVAALGATVVGQFKNLAVALAVRAPASQIPALAALPHVTSVHTVRDYQLDLSETVPWIGADVLQGLAVDGTGVKVAIADSGVDYTHIKLGGNGKRRAYRSATTNSAVVEPGTFFPNSKVAGGWDFVGSAWVSGGTEVPDPDPIDDGPGAFHGTHVSDIIGGYERPGMGDPGVAPGVQEWMFKVCSSITSSCSGLALLQATDAAADLDGNPLTWDPADVMNFSIGAPYGQPEDDWTFFVNLLANNYGTVISISAGNSGDVPFIVGSASVANEAISVAQSEVPSAFQFHIVFNTPSHAPFTNVAHQSWSPLPAVVISGDVVYDTTSTSTRRGCTDGAGTSPWTGTPFLGKVVFVDRGLCAGSMKVNNAEAAGAVMTIIGLVASGAPFSFAYGGGVITKPAFMISLADATTLKGLVAAGTVNISVGPGIGIGLADGIVGTSSRGPRGYNDNAIKPDIAAPGGSVSAEVETGTGVTPFGGTSGAAPMIAGSAALLKQVYGGSLTPQQYRALLMNTASPDTYLGGNPAMGGLGFLAPITRQGAGRVDVENSYNTKTIAMDITNHLADPKAGLGSLSFGFRAVTGWQTLVRTVRVWNLDTVAHTYDISAAFRYAADVGMGVSLKPIPGSLTIPPGGFRNFKVYMSMKPEDMRTWALDKGLYGNSGTDLTGANPTLTDFEYDGFVTVDGGTNNLVRLPWHVLPRASGKVSARPRLLTFPPRIARRLLVFGNSSKIPTDVSVFALVDRSPNVYTYTVGSCAGCNTTLIDLKEVGVTSYLVPGIGLALGFPGNDALMEFANTIWDRPYRVSQFPVEFDIYVDSNLDGVEDYVIFNYDLALTGADGRNAVFIQKLSPPFPLSVYFYTLSDFDTQTWDLPVPAGAIGLTNGQKFNFYVGAWESYFVGTYTDCSPAASCDATPTYHTMTVGTPKYTASPQFFTVPGPGNKLVTVMPVPGGAAASPSQIGLLALYRTAPVGRESDSILIAP